MHYEGTVFGGADRFTGLAVFFDTYGNAKHVHSFPYVSAMVGDGRTAYDHERDNEATIAGQGCEASIRGDGIDTIKARVTYFENRVLELELMDATRVWKKCFAVSNVNLPAKGYIAFSAATGGVTDNHDIMRVTTYANMEVGAMRSGFLFFVRFGNALHPLPAEEKV